MTAPTLNYSTALDNSTGETIFFRDTTVDYGVDGKDNYSDVKQVRLLCGNYYDQVNTTTLTEGDDMEEGRQYLKTAGSSAVYDLKTVVVGDYFIPFTTGLTVASGDTFVTTGYFNQYINPSDYLPASNQNVLNLDTSYWGFSASTYPSYVLSGQYEIYGDTSPDPPTTVTEDVQYIVTGTGSATAVAGGNTYRVGEVFIAQATGAVTFTGDGNLKQLIASKSRYFVFPFDEQNRFDELVLRDTCSCCQNPLLWEIMVKLDAVEGTNFSQWISVSKTTELIEWIDRNLTILENAN